MFFFFTEDKSATAVCTLAFSIGKRALKSHNGPSG
jgi:hypothetical protein